VLQPRPATPRESRSPLSRPRSAALAAVVPSLLRGRRRHVLLLFTFPRSVRQTAICSLCGQQARTCVRAPRTLFLGAYCDRIAIATAHGVPRRRDTLNLCRLTATMSIAISVASRSSSGQNVLVSVARIWASALGGYVPLCAVDLPMVVDWRACFFVRHFFLVRQCSMLYPITSNVNTNV